MAVITAISIVPLIGLLAFLLDGGILMAQQRQVQSAADASAQAAAVYLYNKYTTDAGLDPLGKAAALGLSYASSNGYANNGTNSTVTVNIPPKSGLFSGKTGYAEVIIQYNQPRLFSAILGSGTIPVIARTVARGTYAPYSGDSVIALDSSAPSSLSASGTARIVATSNIHVDSSNVAAISVSNSGSFTAPTIAVAGNVSISTNGSLNGSVVPGSPNVGDPLTSLATPSLSSLTTQPSLPYYGSYTMNPGIYNGGVTIGGGMTVTMNPGIYYMQNGGFTVANGATLTGSGVMIYINNGGGSFNFQGGGVINLSPPTSGTFAGVMFYQDRNNATPINIANGSTTTITGTFYAASATINYAGGAQEQYGSQVIANRINLTNNAYVNVNWNQGNVARRPSLNIVE